MRVLLVEPRIGSKMVGYTRLVRPEPLALEYIAGALMEQGHEVRFIDQRVDPTPFEDLFSDFKPALVGTTGYTTDVPEMLGIMKRVKEMDPRVFTMAGGYHASLCPEDFDHDFVDFLCVGEGEETVQELAKAIEAKAKDFSNIDGIIYRKDGGQVQTGLRQRHKVLDDMPRPARHISDKYRDQYHFHFWENPYLVETQRGCAYRCNFCSVWVFHRQAVLYRTPECVVQELKEVSTKTSMVCFVDDEFFQNPRRAERIADLVKEEGIHLKYWAQMRADDVVRWPHLCEKWRDVGMESVLIGLEKISDEDLASTNKRTTAEINEKAIQILQGDLGIDIWGALIVDPSWTRKEFDSLIAYVKRHRIAFPQFTVLTPLPGTQLFKEKLHELTTKNYELFDLLHAVIPTKLPLDEFYANMARLYANTTMGWRELLQRVHSGRIPTSSLGRVRDLLRDVTTPSAYMRSAPDVRKA